MVTDNLISSTSLSETPPPKFIAVALMVVALVFDVSKTVSLIAPKVCTLLPSPISTLKVPSAPLNPCF